MTLPFFYAADLSQNTPSIIFDETNSKHIVQVLRMKENEPLQLTNGKGLVAVAKINVVSKKSCEVSIQSISQKIDEPHRKTGIAISPVKNASRFEWFLEKATELGISEIWPLVCHRTEREFFRHDRMNNICISAMLQSQQAWLPTLHQPIYFDLLMQLQPKNKEIAVKPATAVTNYENKWIAHCEETQKRQLVAALTPGMQDSLIIIGPEGDFTNDEIKNAVSNGFSPVALGNTRLRTETAGVVAATLLQLM